MSRPSSGSTNNEPGEIDSKVKIKGIAQYSVPQEIPSVLNNQVVKGKESSYGKCRTFKNMA